MGQARLGRGTRLFAIGIAATAMATGAYAYTAANTMPDTKAGDGSSEITGYEITDVEYVLATNPENIDAVKFVLDAPAGTVKAKVDDDSTDYADCTEAAGTWTCDLDPDVTVLSADELTVIAAD